MKTRPSKPETWRKAAFFVVALPAVLRAAARLAWLDRRYDLRALADRLRQVRPWRQPYLDNPRYLHGCVNRLIGLLPPRRHGRCIKRSFILLDLWSRCGLQPIIHIGTLKHDDERRFHAWVTVPDGDGAYSHPASEYAELWSH